MKVDSPALLDFLWLFLLFSSKSGLPQGSCLGPLLFLLLITVVYALGFEMALVYNSLCSYTVVHLVLILSIMSSNMATSNVALQFI